jgi:hypothetical protein
VSEDELDAIGPVDYVVIEWPGQDPSGKAAPLLVDLVDRGVIRVLDLAFLTKDEDGAVAGVEFEKVAERVPDLKVFEGASSGLLAADDIAAAGDAMDPGTSAAVLVYENSWAAPFAAAVRSDGGQLVANGRIQVAELEAALDAAEKS